MREEVKMSQADIDTGYVEGGIEGSYICGYFYAEVS
jgi:hypothetical protein